MTIIKNNCHTRCIDGEFLIILQCCEFSLNEFSVYENAELTKLDINLFLHFLIHPQKLPCLN